MQARTITARAEASTQDPLISDLPLPENKKHYPALDGLRGIAVLMVFCQHYIVLPTALSLGWAGVDFFFVLSGFLITGILYDTRHAVNRFSSFYGRRALRIFPLYYTVLLIALAVGPLAHWARHHSHLLLPLYLSNYSRFIWLHDYTINGNITEHLIMTAPHNSRFLFGHFWSLAIEEQFYLVWPLLVFLIKDRPSLRKLCIITFFLCLVARITCLYLVPQPYIAAGLLYRYTPLRADSLLLGGLVALMLRGPEAIWLRRIARPALAIFVTGLAGFEIIYFIIAYHGYPLILTDPLVSTIGFSLVDLFAGVVILVSLAPGSFVFRFLNFKPLNWLGQISYGFYVFHDIPHDFYIHIVQSTYGAGPTRTILLQR